MVVNKSENQRNVKAFVSSYVVSMGNKYCLFIFSGMVVLPFLDECLDNWGSGHTVHLHGKKMEVLGSMKPSCAACKPSPRRRIGGKTFRSTAGFSFHFDLGQLVHPQDQLYRIHRFVREHMH